MYPEMLRALLLAGLLAKAAGEIEAVDSQLLSYLASPVPASGMWVDARAATNGSTASAFDEQRMEELSVRQASAVASLVELERGKWGCPGMEFRMLMPAHTGTCVVSNAIAHSILRANIPCGWTKKKRGNIHQDHLHEVTADRAIREETWKKFNTTTSFVIGKDPWSRVVSAVGWKHGINGSDPPAKQISDFREYLYKHGLEAVAYLRSISVYAYGTPPGSTTETQVLSYVGRAKDMSKSMKHICSIIGIPAEHCVDPSDPVVQQHHVTGGNRVRTEDLFDDELRGRVAERWKLDIERFGFKFGEM